MTTPGQLEPVQGAPHRVSAEKRDVNDQKHGHHKVHAVRGDPDDNLKPHGMSPPLHFRSSTHQLSNSSGPTQETTGAFQ